jgi:hypothetical protein
MALPSSLPERSLTSHEIGVVRRLVDLHGERGTAARLRISRNSLQRLMAQLPSRRGTIALVRMMLAQHEGVERNGAAG